MAPSVDVRYWTGAGKTPASASATYSSCVFSRGLISSVHVIHPTICVDENGWLPLGCDPSELVGLGRTRQGLLAIEALECAGSANYPEEGAGAD